MARAYSIVDAILEINPTAQVQVAANDINKIQWNKGTPVISNEDILAKVAELKTAYDAKEYQRDRNLKPEQGGYPSIGDQLDMIWHDKKNDTTTWVDAIQTVKDTFSKP